jgi:hypothetical protein
MNVILRDAAKCSWQMEEISFLSLRRSVSDCGNLAAQIVCRGRLRLPCNDNPMTSRLDKKVVQ